MANLQYVVWIAAYNSTFLLGYLVLDLAFFPSPLSTSVYSPMSKLKVHLDPDVLKATRHTAGREWEAAGSAPPLLEAVNKNGLVLFLLVRRWCELSFCVGCLLMTRRIVGERRDGLN